LPEYNITKEVVNNRLSLESRLKISKTLKEKIKKGLITNPLNLDKQKEVIIYDADCNCIDKFSSQNAAGRYLEKIYSEFSFKSVNAIVNKKSRNRRGKYKNHFILYPNELCIKDVIRSDAFKILCIDLNTNSTVIYNKTNDLTKAVGCSPSAVLAALKNDRLLLKRYKLTKL